MIWDNVNSGKTNLRGINIVTEPIVFYLMLNIIHGLVLDINLFILLEAMGSQMVLCQYIPRSRLVIGWESTTKPTNWVAVPRM